MNNKEVPWRWEEDGYTVTRGSAWSAPGCHNGCGVLLYTNKEGRLVKVEGDPENSFNQGRLCVRCLDLPEVTNHPDRLQYPLKRVGKRGENKWQRISWDEAYDTIVEEFGKIKEKYGPESVIFVRGTGRDISGYICRLAYSFGSPNQVQFLSGVACYLPRTAGLVGVQGAFAVADVSQYFADRYDNPNWKIPACIVVWGNNTIVSNADGYFGHWIVDCMKRGSKLIVIDPKLTWLASKADLWLQIRPGTDAALALGMLNVIINEQLYDAEFVDNWTYGFEQLAERVQQYPVERVAETTWIPKEKILKAARMFATSKPAQVQWGLAIDMTKEALPATHAIAALWSITGNLDVPGGMVTVFYPFNVQTWGRVASELMSKEMIAKKFGTDKYPIYNLGYTVGQPDVMVDACLTGEPYPVKGAFIQTTNPLAVGQEPRTKILAALKQCDFCVVVDVFMTPTAVAFADIILPAATFPERDGLRALWYSVGAINKAIQVGECKSDMEIDLELGRRWNKDFWPWESVQDMFTGFLKNSGLTFEELREKGVPQYPPFEYKRYAVGKERKDGELGFNTPTGRVELYSTVFESLGLDPLPYFEEPTESPVSRPDLYKIYPLVLTTGARDWASFHSEHRQIPRLRALKPNPQIEIHPDTAAAYGVKDGDWVWIENRMGRCRQKVKLTPTIHPKVVSADHGWWFPEQDGAEPNLFGTFESNTNVLVPFLPGRSGFGANVKSLLCKIYKVREGER